MMNIFFKSREFLEKIDNQSFIKGLAIIFSIFSIMIIGILYYYYSEASRLQKNIKSTNVKREEIQKILKRLALVRGQKEEVNTLLAEEKGFLIARFLSDCIDSVGIKDNLKGGKEPEFSEDDIYNKKYKESRVVSQFTGLTIEPLCRLLSLIEEKKRVYVKDLTIKKTRNATLDVTLTIATLRQQSS